MAETPMPVMTPAITRLRVVGRPRPTISRPPKTTTTAMSRLAMVMATLKRTVMPATE